MNAHRLALGTAQLGMHYGIANQHGIPSDGELSDMLVLARTNGITTIDTAAAYGNAEQRLGEADLSGFRIVSKFPAGTNPSASIRQSLVYLRAEKLYGLMAHNADDLLRDATAWDELLKVKQDGKADRIGFSLYTPYQLEHCLRKNFVPDIVQVPYSLLDRRFEQYFDELKQLGCEIHARSVFLQGLYFLTTLPDRLKDLADSLHMLRETAAESSLSMEELALAFALSEQRIDHAVVGVESAGQLQRNIEAASKTLTDELKNAVLAIRVSNEELLNPSKW